ncbi:hypothetical protein Ancab_004580 [Ancistrocladus abbreviatus]
MMFCTKPALGGTLEPCGSNHSSSFLASTPRSRIVETIPNPYQPAAGEERGSEEAVVGSMISLRCTNYSQDNASRINYANDKASPLSSISQKEHGTLAPSPPSLVATLKRQGPNGIPWFTKQLRKVVGNGQQTLFSEDQWARGHRLQHKFPHLYQLASNKQSTINELGVWKDRKWSRSLHWSQAVSDRDRHWIEALVDHLVAFLLPEDKSDT